MREALQPIIDKVWRHCATNGVRGRTVTLKMKDADFSIVRRSRSEANLIDSRDGLEDASIELLRKLMPARWKVRLLGVCVSALRCRGACADAPGITAGRSWEGPTTPASWHSFAGLSRAMGREVATVAQARELLGL